VRLFGDEREFNYEQPQMIYDKKTGDVTILDPKAGKRKKIIKSNKELEIEKQRLYKELGVKEDSELNSAAE
jgi:hypothetical protein